MHWPRKLYTIRRDAQSQESANVLHQLGCHLDTGCFGQFVELGQRQLVVLAGEETAARNVRMVLASDAFN